MVTAYQTVTGLDLSFTRCIIPGGLLHPHNLLTSVNQCLTVGCERSNLRDMCSQRCFTPLSLGNTAGLVKVVLEAVTYVVPE